MGAALFVLYFLFIQAAIYVVRKQQKAIIKISLFYNFLLMKNHFSKIAVLLLVLTLPACTPAVNNTNTPLPQTNSAQTSTNSAMLDSHLNVAIKTEDVTYFENTKGFFAAPEQVGNYPGVVMIHEWWGLNDNIKDMARQLAKEGYNVLAVDLYNGVVAKTADEARAQTSGLDQNKALQNMKAALSFLKTKGATKLASFGWCFGGGQSMQLALNESDLSATVIYYGTLIDDETQLKNIKWPVLGVFGDKDQSITPDKVKAFETALNKLGIQNEIHIYPGVGHAFANPSGQSYAPNETKDAWEKTLKFLNQNLKTA